MLTPTTPRRAPFWPPLVERLASLAPAPERLYLVGGIVRDALRGIPIHDIDLATPDDGLQIARHLANELGGAYYPIDPERGTGRAIVADEGQEVIIDVATFRGPDLLADLEARDFTVNAMAVRMDKLDSIYDPLDGQADLFDNKLLRQCDPSSIGSDPIRALRAIRQSLQLSLRLEKATLLAARAASSQLLDEQGLPVQAERARDELFKILGGKRPAAGLRLLHTLGLLSGLCPFPLPSGKDLENSLTLVEQLHNLLTLISPRRDDNSAAQVILGVAVMILDRFRGQLQEHLVQHYGAERNRSTLLLLGAFTPIGKKGWVERLRLSNAEERVLINLAKARHAFPPLTETPDDRAIHSYYRATGEAGVDGVLLRLAEMLAEYRYTLDAKTWGATLEHIAAPLLDAYFHRHQQVIAPPPLITGRDLMKHLNLQPGPQIGQLLEQLLEEQAAGTIRTQKQALRLAERLVYGPTSTTNGS